MLIGTESVIEIGIEHGPRGGDVEVLIVGKGYTGS
jgi:hypothetical protein